MERRRTRLPLSPERGVKREWGGYDARMRYAGAWRRRGMLATAVTFVLPAAMAAAVAVGLLSGGLRLGAASQMLTGPEVPAAASATAPAHAAPPDRLPTVPAAPRRVFGPAAVAAPAPAPAATTAPATRPVGAAPQRGPVSGAPSSVAATAATPSSSPPPSSPSRNPFRELGQTAADNAGKLPAPIGPAGHDAIMRVVELVPPPPALGKALKLP